MDEVPTPTYEEFFERLEPEPFASRAVARSGYPV